MLLSVLLPIKNEDVYILEKCLNSIQNQTFKDFELIIIDDSNHQDIISFLDNFCKYSNLKVKLIRKKRKNSNLASALNIGIDCSCGTYLARLDSDDIQKNSRFEIQISFLQTNPNIYVVGSNVDIIDESGSILGVKHYPEFNHLIKKYLSIFNPLCHSALMFRREFFFEVGYYDENLFRAEDYSLWLEARELDLVNFHNIQENLVLYRISNIEKRDILNWTTNLKLKLKYFSSKYFVESCLGIFFIVLFFASPKFLKSLIYKKYAIW